MLALSRNPMTLSQALDEIADLKKEVLRLRERLSVTVAKSFQPESAFPLYMKLSKSESIVLLVLMNRRFAPHEMLIDSLYGTRSDGGPECAIQVIRLTVMRLRKKIRRFGIEVQSRFGIGYEISEADQNKLRELLGRK